MYAGIDIPHIRTAFCSAMNTTDTLSTQISVTSGAANVKGSWVQLEASTAFEVYGFYVGFYNAGVSGSAVRVIYDIGIGGPGSEVVLVPDFLSSVGQYNSTVLYGGGMMYFPLYIAKGTRIAIRTQATTASKACLAAMILNYGNGAFTPIFEKCTALGITKSAATAGVSVTPGTSNYGSYVTIATTTTAFKALLQHVGVADSSMPSSFVSVATGIGSSDIFRRGYISTSSENISPMGHMAPFFGSIPNGTVLQARAKASAADAVSVAFLGFH